MTDRPKPKPVSGKNRNDARPNGKASKKNPGQRRAYRLSDLQRVLMGKGGFKRWVPVGAEPTTQWPAKAKTSD